MVGPLATSSRSRQEPGAPRVKGEFEPREFWRRDNRTDGARSLLIPYFGPDYNIGMQTKRERVAQILDRVRIFDLILRARSLTRAPVLSVLCYHSIGDP